MVRVLLLIALILAAGISNPAIAQRRRRNKQEIQPPTGVRNAAVTKKSDDGVTVTSTIDNQPKSKTKATDEIESEDYGSSTVGVNTTYICPEKSNKIKYAWESFWRNDLLDAYFCASEYLKSRKDDGLAQAIMYSISRSKYFFDSADSSNRGHLRIDAGIDSGTILNWEVIGPFPVSKLEVDGDPVFSHAYFQRLRDQGTSSPTSSNGYAGATLDVAAHILTMKSSVPIPSELLSGQGVSWKSIKATSQNQGRVDVRFPINWNELVQGLSTTSILEFQGWARTSTYVSSNGFYSLHCPGVHTVYVRNDNNTRVVVGDVYQTGHIIASLDLKAGPVGIVLPLRGAAQSAFACSLSAAATTTATPSYTNPFNAAASSSSRASAAVSIIAQGPTNVPNLVDISQLDPTDAHGFSSGDNMGLLVSTVFSILLQNPQTHQLTVEIQIENQRSSTGPRLSVRQARLHARADVESIGGDGLVGSMAQIALAPGQLLSVPLELFSEKKGEHIFLPCRASTKFNIIISPSRGQQALVPLEFECRKSHESFLISYVDHDQSITQASVVLPLLLSKPFFSEELFDFENISSVTGAAPPPHISASDSKPQTMGEKGGGSRYESDERDEAQWPDESLPPNRKQTKNVKLPSDKKRGSAKNQVCKAAIGRCTIIPLDSFPVLLSLHGTGLTPTSQADAYKMMPSADKDRGQRAAGSGKDKKQIKGEYRFGVEGFFVFAPTRHGAHNWEAIGYMSAMRGVTALREVMSRFHGLLPQVRDGPGAVIIAGHSMGGHGAWVAATNSPDLSTCVAPAAGWIRKEEYSSSNSFFNLHEIQSVYVDPALKMILERAMSEFHVDKFSGNLQHQNVYIRVGSHDMTTHPWFSRRMHRLLVERKINSVLEETPGKQHWWWDTDAENDGGALNDPKLRSFYRSCLQKYLTEYLAAAMTSMVVSEATMAVAMDDPSAGNSDATTTFASTTLFPSAVTADSTIDNSGYASNVGTEMAEGSGKQDGNVTFVPPNEQENLVGDFGIDDIHAFSESKREEEESHIVYKGSWASLSYTDRQVIEATRCHKNFTLTVFNAGTQMGMCGVRVLQQYRYGATSAVQVRCAVALDSSQAGLDRYTDIISGRVVWRCDLDTINVRRLSIKTDAHSTFFRAEELYVDGTLVFKKSYTDEVSDALSSQRSLSFFYSICWSSHDRAAVKVVRMCDTHEIDSLQERSPQTSGPVRQVYARPFYVIYGSSQDHRLRVSMRDLAIYIANAHVAAHGTTVRVLSEVEYQSGRYIQEASLVNLVLIGGPAHNRIMKKTTSLVGEQKNSSSDSGNTKGGDLELTGRSPITFGTSEVSPPLTSSSSSSSRRAAMRPFFGIGPYKFTGDEDAVIFTLPLARQGGVLSPIAATGAKESGEEGDDVNSAFAVCVAANSAAGYVHISRLAWPVVPPMVRAPFANYIPDFLVVDGAALWAMGLGAVRAAGFWNATWGFDPLEAYVK